MFYSETLLSKTGPLARVWLSANLERKLNKNHILQSNIQTSVNAIVDQGQAPMALRLSGQLLLGVVRIYSRKARYLMDDCNEALLKIKMAFRPGNIDVDLVGPITSEIPNPNLNMPDLLAEPEIPAFDESFFNSQPMDLDFGLNDGNALNWTSQVFSDPASVEIGRRDTREELSMLYDDDLGLDITDGAMEDPSIEIGRNARPSLLDNFMDDEPKLHEDDLGLDFDEDPMPPLANDDLSAFPTEDHVPMQGLEDDGDFRFDVNDEAPAPEAADEDQRPARGSASPLSSARSSIVREFEDTTLTEVPTPKRARQPASKKRKILPTDEQTVLPTSVIKQQQADRSAITKPTSFLPHDPVLLALMQMQQSGAFVSNLMGDGLMRGMAPELRGILSIEVIRKSANLKRKRDSGIADVEQADGDLPELELPTEDDDFLLPQDEGVADLSRNEDESIVNLPAEDAFLPAADDDEELALSEADEEVMSPARDNFDETTAPLLHPDEQGPISVGTQHAVHILRDFFGGSAEASQQKKSAQFQDLYPESRTSKAEATQMFFETLVLATKDAIKVDQTAGSIGGLIRIRPKRSLWGEWAEKGAQGEISQEREGAESVVAA